MELINFFLESQRFHFWVFIVAGCFLFILFICWLQDVIEKYGLDRDIF